MSLWVVPGAVVSPTEIDVTTGLTGPDYEGVPATWIFSFTGTDDASGDPRSSLLEPSLLTVDTSAVDTAGAAPTQLRLAVLEDGAWTVLETTRSAGSLGAWITELTTYAVVEEPTSAVVTVDQESSAPADGRHRIDPGSSLTLAVTVTPVTKLYHGSLVTTLPEGWIVENVGDGSYDPNVREVTWVLPITRPGTSIVRAVVLKAPMASPEDGGSVIEATFASRVVQPDAAPTAAPDYEVLVAPAVVIEHTLLGQVDPVTRAAAYLGEDTPIEAQPVFDVFRVRFRLENVDTVPVTVTAPQLEFRPAGAGDDAWQPVPGPVSPGSAPFRAASEAADSATGLVTLAGAEARMADAPNLSLASADGFRAEGVTPGPDLSIPGSSAVEAEFSVSATVFATYLSGYEFRIADGPDSAWVRLWNPAVAQVVIGPEPAPNLSPDQRDGVAVAGARYQLTQPPTSSSLLGPSGPAGASLPLGSPHGDISLSTDSCGACHRAHTAQGANLLTADSPVSQICFSCHDGLGASTGPSGQWATATANDPTTASYYQHPATAPDSGHTSLNDEEFKGVFNRHSECTDCHNPHYPMDTSLPSVETANGWTVSGALTGESGVGVTNPPAPATEPTYTFLRQDPTGVIPPLTYEYQLCFKCHSGYTDLSGLPNSPTNDPDHPSQWALDKGSELDPNNPGSVSYHPIEQAGTNASAAMDASLAGTSSYKLWNFTSADTVRCTQCHADSAQYPALKALADQGVSTAGDRLDDHVSANRGILLGNYRDRVLHTASDTGTTADYSAQDFQLCYFCHAEAPFVTSSKDPQSDTNFPLHGLHVSYLAAYGTSTDADIDTAGAGAGNAICAECHYRIHSTADRVGSQDAYTGLVNFAPDVTDVGPDAWQKTATGGSCALTCHGYTHTAGPTGNSLYVSVAP